MSLPDGRAFVLKHIRPRDDLVMRATRDVGRAALLWTTGVLQRLPRCIDPGMLWAEPTPEGWVLAMRDLSKYLLPHGRILTHDESHWILRAVTQMHTAFEGEPVPHLSTLAEFYALSSPAVWRRVPVGGHPLRSRVLRGWELFSDLIPQDVSSAVLAILDRPALLARELGRHRMTLVHGDLWYANLGLTRRRVVIIDWGLATKAPGAVDFAGYLMEMAQRVQTSREALLEVFRALQGDRHEERALRLALLGGLVQLGWTKAYHAVENPDPDRRGKVDSELRWWVEQARRTLEVWSPA